MGLPTTGQRLDEAETAIGRKLPQPLRTRLESNNGGEVLAEGEEWILFPVWDPTNRKSMIRSANHIIKETTSARSWSGFPEDATAIASNGCGDLLVLYPDGDTIWYWDHETGQSEPAEVNWGT